MKLKVRTAPKEDSRLNNINLLPSSNESAEELPSQAAIENVQPDASASLAGAKFNCDGRDHCSQMTSCEEATFFLENCPNQQTDGDHDGIPCEMQWCGY